MPFGPLDATRSLILVHYYEPSKPWRSGGARAVSGFARLLRAALQMRLSLRKGGITVFHGTHIFVRAIETEGGEQR
jgi:hypothetical protein